MYSEEDIVSLSAYFGECVVIDGDELEDLSEKANNWSQRELHEVIETRRGAGLPPESTIPQETPEPTILEETPEPSIPQETPEPPKEYSDIDSFTRFYVGLCVSAKCPVVVENLFKLIQLIYPEEWHLLYHTPEEFMFLGLFPWVHDIPVIIEDQEI
ncbi:unnamed protein product [Leptosia nina]|uniref:Uncharacterized protein n=1 Tax=Leptosia nina TaxID=320188 RepID=A0AAV1JZ64_9NEOP